MASLSRLVPPATVRRVAERCLSWFGAASAAQAVRDWATALAIFALALAIYRASPVRDLLDPKYTLLTTESLVTTGSFDLSPFLPGLAAKQLSAGGPVHKLPWQLVALDGRLVYFYPSGTSLLSAPFFAVQRLFGATTLDRRGIYSGARERTLQATLAALFTAGAVLLGYRVARRELPVAPAALVALAAALGSGWWSVTSRVLWSHTWTAVLLAGALLELLRWEDGRERRPALLAALLVAAFWVRPTNAFSAAAFTLYVAWRHRAALARLVVVGAAGFALHLGFSLAVFSTWFPTYMRHVVPGGHLDPPAAIVGQLLSAEHGLLVFSPILLLVGWTLTRRGVARERREIAALSLGLVGFYLLYHCWRSRWWGAGTVGPRFLCDVTPYLLWLGAHAWRREREAAGGARWLLRTAAALLALAGVAAHATGALRVKPGLYSGKPRGERREQLAPLGSRAYWSELPQLATARWLVRGQRDDPGGARSADSPLRRGARR